jgi:mRNA-degrading endonuclease YafQ of YafQ-DinJ toxin-antitoxin module
MAEHPTTLKTGQFVEHRTCFVVHDELVIYKVEAV